MRRRGALPELLAPAGDFDCLVAAVRGGADAVYLGAKSFGARAFAKNFELDELRRAVVYCHLHGVRVYVTINTLLTDGEMGDAVSLARELYSIGVDALIVADLGLVSVLRRVLPGMELHASTQMSVHNSDGADIAHELGCTRVVLAREVSGADIAKITEKCKPEIEVFLHGALCVSHSGQCLFSSLVGGRSGNRGECAQPCRLPYKQGYQLSLTDLSLAGHIPSLIASGVASLKIEGRMKSPDYVYTVTSIYRRLLDEGRAARREEEERLARAFSRGGFTDGYYVGRLDKRRMLGIRSEEDKRASAASRGESAGADGDISMPRRVRVRASVTIEEGAPASMTLRLSVGGAETSVTVSGETPAPAMSRPLNDADVRSRLCKMGNTFFELSGEGIDLTLDEGLNLSPASLNALRRAACEALETAVALGDRSVENAVNCDTSPDLSADNSGAALENSDIRDGGLSVNDSLHNRAFGNRGELAFLPEVRRTALMFDPALYNEVGNLDGLIDLAFIPLWRIGEATRDGFGIAMPPVIMESEWDEVNGLLCAAKDRGVKYALVGNLGQLRAVREHGLIPLADFRFNITNFDTGATLSALGVNNCLPSPELTAPQARFLRASALVYGRVPLMLTERCFMSDNGGCKSCSACSLTDRKGVSFPMLREFRHRTLILNSAVTYMGDRMDELRDTRGAHFIFTTESAGEAREIARAYKSGAKFPLAYPHRRMGRRTVKSN